MLHCVAEQGLDMEIGCLIKIQLSVRDGGGVDPRRGLGSEHGSAIGKARLHFLIN